MRPGKIQRFWQQNQFAILGGGLRNLLYGPGEIAGRFASFYQKLSEANAQRANRGRHLGQCRDRRRSFAKRKE
ncbi:hypothetical protein GCM10028822_09510 [Hymenobacter terrigena]